MGSPQVGVAVEFRARGMWEVPFWNLAATEDYRHLHRGSCRTSLVDPPPLDHLGGTLRFSDTSEGGRRLWTYEFQDASVLLAIWGERLDVMVLAASIERARDCCHTLEEALDDAPERDDSIPVSFWTWTSGGPRMSSRRLHMPGWADVERNYPSAVRAALNPLLAAEAPGDARLVLWHGPPGTGKTTALRALARAWHEWADLHYIVDPEEFFGSGATYMTDVLLDRADSEKTALLVLEDAGELIAPEARADTGQGLSRLLNLTDGMLGQGMQTVVLITTNEPLSVLHPAAARPGRCWAEVEFPAHTREEANRWLARSDHDVRVSRETTLAELFALGRGVAPPVERRFGFG